MNPLEAVVWIRSAARDGEARRIRLRAGISAPELARHVGVNPSSLWRWETGKTTPRARAARRWATALAEIDNRRLLTGAVLDRAEAS